MPVDQSGGLRMEIGVLYLSHAPSHPMLVLAELIVCSTRVFACILAKWFWPAVMSLSLTYGSPEALCNKRAYTYFGRRSASLMEEFWTPRRWTWHIYRQGSAEYFRGLNFKILYFLGTGHSCCIFGSSKMLYF